MNFFKVIFSILIILSFNSLAKTNVGATYIENGKYLSIKLIDDPAQGPYLAGSIWSALKGTDRLKKFASDDFGIKCDAMKSTINNDYFGSCRLLIRSEILVDVTGDTIGFHKRDQEANKILTGFNEPMDIEIILKGEIFSLNLDFKHSLVTFEVLKSAINE